jgi:hypothetical protein
VVFTNHREGIERLSQMKFKRGYLKSEAAKSGGKERREERER